MNLFAKQIIRWFNINVKNTKSVKDKIVSKHFESQEEQKYSVKRTDINILLNRVKINQKNESKKKFYFSALASSGLILFGFLLFN
tara:strand:- start:284 stop:538 length:255 start_codon:yes stop_codon:yes gene_type:complete